MTPTVKKISAEKHFDQAFSFCSLVTDWKCYQEFLESCGEAGFSEEDCEFLAIDNAQGNSVDAYEGINRMLDEARGRYVVLCHQDVELLDRRTVLESQLAKLNESFPDWALAGNAGGDAEKIYARISDPHGSNQCSPGLPKKVDTLDENFIVVNAKNRVAASGNMKGFHLYGADLCILSDVLGYSSWVIDYHLYHKSKGSVGDKQSTDSLDFYPTRERLIGKFEQAFRPRSIRTTCTRLNILVRPKRRFFRRAKL